MNAYEEASFMYVLRLMLSYERYSLAIPYFNFIVKALRKPISDFNILDYGCGVSDIGILVASLGAKVTIADLDGQKLDFTIWRYNKRGLNPTVIKIKSPAEYPVLAINEYDLIIATEVFEHVRDPLRLLKNLASALQLGGFLLNSVRGFKKELVGDHLAESLDIGNSEEYKEYYKKRFEHILLAEDQDFLFKKIL